MPAWMIKLTPFARRHRSSIGETPSMIEGELASSASVKNHWSPSYSSIISADRDLSRAVTGEGLRNRGGEGTAGGILRWSFRGEGL